MSQENLIKAINALKKEKNAVILAHNYQRPEIYKIADFLGDSLDLSRKAAEINAKIIVFCGVRFMAETAKIISPEKTVLLPSKDAGCPLADTLNAEQLIELKKKYPGVPVVAYINTSAEVKALVDYVCTSMNAIKIIEHVDSDRVIFVPDKNMGRWLQGKTNKKLIIWNGSCFAHNKLTGKVIKEAKKNHPDAKVVAHPECRPDVLKLSDRICGTGGMITYARKSDAKEFIIATEEGMCNRLKLEAPDKRFYCFGNVCYNMKYTTLEKVKQALEKNQHEIVINKDVAEKAQKAIAKMLEIG